MGRGFGISAVVDHGVVREVAALAEALGYASVWVNDVPHADGLAALLAAAEATTRIRLGVGVVPLDQRPPAPLARQVRESSLPLDRLLLGVGSGAAGGALRRVRDGVHALRSELAVPIVVGALGPNMAALAGEVADGVLFNWQTPGYAAVAARWTGDAADRAGRARPTVMAYVRCGLSPGAADALRRELAHYDGVRSFEQHVRRMGASGHDTCVLAPDAASLQAGIAPYDAVYDETIVRAITPDDRAESIVTLLRACAP
jgi:alkanesulfonate monooxygenase SsuD/methylene tetrahydromethanopterin reductase-like flavin-dependent oxidoreductase (luciferase family)